jgi:MFS family permease
MPADFARRAACFGFFAALTSGAGQTYFIGLFGEPLRATLGLSEGQLGLVYGLATLLSGSLMFWLGAVADRISLPRAALLALGCMSLGAGLLATASHPLMLLPAFLLLRLGGQGLCGHIAIVAAARHADARRGRALSIAAFGFIVGEALWPLVITASLDLMPWRAIWTVTAGVLLLVGLPLLAGLSRPLPPPVRVTSDAQTPSLRRIALLRTPRFLAALTVVLLPPFIITALFFHQSSIGGIKGWSLADIAPAFAIFAVAQAVANWLTGRAIDRIGSVAVLRYQILPLVPALLALVWLPPAAGPWLVFALLGMMSGANQVNAGALWAELFGTQHMGKVRGVAAAIMVLATAVAPALLGLALDAGIPMAAWSLPVALYAAVVPLLASRVITRHRPMSR